MGTYFITLDGAGNGSGNFGYYSTTGSYAGNSDTIYISIGTNFGGSATPAETFYYVFGNEPLGYYGGSESAVFDLPSGWSLSLIAQTPLFYGANRYDFRVYNDTGGDEGRIAFRGNSVDIVCFAVGTMIETAAGPQPIEALAPDDRVLTRDNGFQPLRWVGRTRVSAATLAAFPELAPVRFAAGALGDHAETAVSPNHRVLLSGWRAEALYGTSEVLVAAKEPLNDHTILRATEPEPIEYYHLLFDRHELVLGDGLWSESFQPAHAEAVQGSAATRDEVVTLFPNLEACGSTAPARPPVSALDVAVLS